MKKIIGVMKKVKKTIYVCDLCGKKEKLRKCPMCKKDVCPSCLVKIDSFGAYFDVYCISCWRIGQKYRKQLEELDNAYDKRYDEIQKAWKGKIK